MPIESRASWSSPPAIDGIRKKSTEAGPSQPTESGRRRSAHAERHRPALPASAAGSPQEEATGSDKENVNCQDNSPGERQVNENSSMCVAANAQYDSDHTITDNGTRGSQSLQKSSSSTMILNGEVNKVEQTESSSHQLLMEGNAVYDNNVRALNQTAAAEHNPETELEVAAGTSSARDPWGRWATSIAVSYQQLFPPERSLFILGPNSIVRRACASLLAFPSGWSESRRFFDNLILLCILMSSVSLAFENPRIGSVRYVAVIVIHPKSSVSAVLAFGCNLFGCVFGSLSSLITDWQNSFPLQRSIPL